MEWIYNDGGRSKYFKATDVGDCAIRSIAIATGKDYKEVYDALKKLNGGKSCRNGTPKKVDKKYLQQIGWIWHPTMGIGTGCNVHLKEEELPKGTLIVQVSAHLTCVKDGVIYDTFDCSRGGTRCVYGYWTEPKKPIDELKKKFCDAMDEHSNYQSAYLESLKKAKECFENDDADGMRQNLEVCNVYLRLSANAREEMDKYEKELKRRHSGKVYHH